MSAPTPGFATPSPLRTAAAHGQRPALVAAAVRPSAAAMCAAEKQQHLQAPTSRRAFLALAAASTLTAAAAATTAGPRAARAALTPVPAAAAGAVRHTSQMTGDYKTDAAKMLQDMKEATELGRGAPGMAETVARVRADMNDFVALYRRNDKVAGSPSYSTLYTATNTLSGHYASYGPTYPVPEKRKKRLQQQFSEIERALARGR